MDNYDKLLAKIKGSFNVVITEPQVVSALTQLPQLQQTLVRAHFLQCKTKSLIAKEQSLSSNKVSVEIAKAVSTLQSQLNPEWRQYLDGVVTRARVQ